MRDILVYNATRMSRGQIRSVPRERFVVRPVAPRRSVSSGSIDGIKACSRRRITEVVCSVDVSPPPIYEEPVFIVDSRLRRQLSRAAVRADVVARAIAPNRQKPNRRWLLFSRSRRSLMLSRIIVTVLAVAVLAATCYIGIDTINTNNQVKKAIIAQPSADNADTTSSSQPAQEGSEEVAPSSKAVTNYNVAPSLPRMLSIDKINVKARVLPMEVNADGSVQAPRNIFDAGWYTGSVKPGEIGAMFIDAHASGATREGLFAYLDRLSEGDMIDIEKGDGTHLSYKVVHTETQPLDGLDMKKMLLPYGTSLRGLNMMTCTGKWVESSKTYDKRVLVFAEQI